LIIGVLVVNGGFHRLISWLEREGGQESGEEWYMAMRELHSGYVGG